jgi:hypothetical protein
MTCKRLSYHTQRSARTLGASSEDTMLSVFFAGRPKSDRHDDLFCSLPFSLSDLSDLCQLFGLSPIIDGLNHEFTLKGDPLT